MLVCQKRRSECEREREGERGGGGIERDRERERERARESATERGYMRSVALEASGSSTLPAMVPAI